MFDSWAGELAPHDFASFSLPTLSRIASGVRSALASSGLSAVPMTLFAKGANQPETLALLANSGYDTVGLDWCISPITAHRVTEGKFALQGNLDPNVLYGGREAIEREVRRMCTVFRSARNDGNKSGPPKAWIANLGHGITPGVDPEDMRFFLECVLKYSSKDTEL